MRRKRTVIALVLAIVCGGMAGFAALQLMRVSPQQLQAEPRASTRTVVVASRPIALGSIIGEEDIKLVQWPGEAIPAGFAASAADVVGRGTITPLQVNEPLLTSKLADRSAGGGLPIVIPEGMRAVSVRVDDVISVAGFVGPQTRVDVLLTMQASGSGEPISRIVLQNVQAIAANQQIDRSPNGEARTISVLTVLVSPEDAERLTIASTQGKIQLALRNTLDMKESNTAGARVRELLAGGTPARTAGVAARPQVSSGPAAGNGTVEVFKGGVRALITYSR